MRNEIWASLVWAALAIAPFSGLKANSFVVDNNIKWLGNKVNTELYHSLYKDNPNEISLQWAMESEPFSPIHEKVVINATLNYFDEQVHLYSLEWKARENVQIILKDYLSVHPILKKDSKWNMLFLIDNKSEFADMIKSLANTLFDWMPKVIRKIAIFLVFWWNEELQDTLNNLDYTVMNLSIKQYKDIVFDYFLWIVKNVASAMDLKITLRDYYTAVHKYYPNKNHVKILEELENTWKFDEDVRYLKYPFKK